MRDLIQLALTQTTVLEMVAALVTLASVILAVKLKISQYPVGIFGTILYLMVFWDAKLYSSVGLQVYFTIIQLYGWWFWMRGDKGREPPITDWSWGTVAKLGGLAVLFTVGVSGLLTVMTDAKAAVLDTAILAASVLAQFLLDRKKLKSWVVWFVVDVLSVIVYGGQHLVVTTALYVFLTVNTVVGFYAWVKADDATVSWRDWKSWTRRLIA